MSCLILRSRLGMRTDALAAPPTDYDLERLRNIDENRALLKDLGIAM